MLGKMLDDTEMSALLTQLSSIAHSPMTARQRETRAAPVLAAAGATIDEVCKAVKLPELSWNQTRARTYGVTIETWLEAARIACDPPPQDLDSLLDRLHQAEAAVSMLKGGYTVGRDASGRLKWVRPESTPA